VPVLSLGRTPLANALVDKESAPGSEATYPLDLVFCTACSLVQIVETVPPEVLFREYLYFSSFSDAMVDHARRLAGRLVAERGLGPEELVVEIASNDGYLLQHYVARGVPVLGVEPALNIAKVARERGIETITEFFGEALGRKLAQRRRASVIHANNVVAHVPDINGFFSGIAALLAEDGVAVIETPYVREMVERVEFDTIYHEHLFYYSLTAFAALAHRHGLVVANVELIPIHGVSLRVFLQRRGEPGPAVVQMLAEEERLGVAKIAFYTSFAKQVERLRYVLTRLVADLKSAKRRVAAYGASAKGATLLNYCGIDAASIDFIADRSTHKQGKLMPGARIPIEPPEVLRERRPEYCLLLTWNFAEEIFAQQREYVEGGGRFVVPVPDVRIV
jgi:SAM-dependent methyltransferase